ncbi:MAG TPA: hypothetical protein VHE14_08375, partial [Solirubrobacteraceae bacterium]|nr:hypothetical protein [Solirubrobacteraceae bacterium]
MAGRADLFVVCKSCGSEVSAYITECPYCGTRLRKRAPKLERDRPAKRSSGASRARARLGRLRANEIPGIRPDSRPWATIALVLASVGATIAWESGAIAYHRLVVFGPPHDEWWRVLSAPFTYGNVGYQF